MPRKQTPKTPKIPQIDSASVDELTELNKNLDAYALERAKEHLGVFGYLTFGWDYRYAHIQKYIDKLHKLATGEINRLIIMAPPRHAKTNWSVIAFSAWLLGNNKDRRILHVCDTGDQAHLNSIAVRDTIKLNEKYREIFPNVYPDKHKPQSESGWFLNISEVGRKDPTFSAYGSGGAIVGRGCDFLLVDDACNNENTATRYQRDKLYDWYSSKIESRVERGSRLICMHRWHEEDLIGKILKKEGTVEEGGLWHVLKFKALNEVDGEQEALWPEFQPLYKILQDKNRNPLIFEALWQQKPEALSGQLIKLDWLQPRPKIFDINRLVIGVDLAISQRETADFTAITVLAIDKLNRICVVWMEKGRWTFLEQVQRIENIYRIGNSLGADFGVQVEAIAIESNQYQQAMAQILRAASFLPIVEVKSLKDKVSRAAPWIARAQAGDFYVDQTLPIWPDFMLEAVSFGSRMEHDDCVDSISSAWSLLEESSSPTMFVI